MWNRKASSSICGFAALYMWYIAYQLYPGREPDTTMSPLVSWIFIVFFALAGVMLAVIAFRQYRAAEQEEKQKRDDESLK